MNYLSDYSNSIIQYKRLYNTTMAFSVFSPNHIDVKRKYHQLINSGTLFFAVMEAAHPTPHQERHHAEESLKELQREILGTSGRFKSYRSGRSRIILRAVWCDFPPSRIYIGWCDFPPGDVT